MTGCTVLEVLRKNTLVKFANCGAEIIALATIEITEVCWLATVEIIALATIEITEVCWSVMVIAGCT